MYIFIVYSYGFPEKIYGTTPYLLIAHSDLITGTVSNGFCDWLNYSELFA